MAGVDKSILVDLVNGAFKYKFGEDLFVDNNINYEALINVGNDIIVNGNALFELKKNSGLKGQEADISIIDGRIIIEKSVEEYVKFAVRCVVNEFDTISSSINAIYSGQHDDRVAKIISAKRKYLMACETDDMNIKKRTLLDAESIAVDGIAEIENEIRSAVNRINEIPKSFIDKIFKAKIKVEEVDLKIKTLRESIVFYEEAVVLLNILSSELNEANRVNIAIDESKKFFESILTEENCLRMSNFDVEDDNFWSERVYDQLKYLNRLKSIMEKDSLVYKLNVGRD